MINNKSRFDYSKLRGRIREKYGSEQAFSREIGLSNVSVSAKLNGKSRFSQDDILGFIVALDIDPNDIGVYFFTSKL